MIIFLIVISIIDIIIAIFLVNIILKTILIILTKLITLYYINHYQKKIYASISNKKNNDNKYILGREKVIISKFIHNKIINYKTMYETEKDKYKSETFVELMHEIKTPVFTIQGYVDTVFQNINNLTKKETKFFILKAKNNIERLSKLIVNYDEIIKVSSKYYKIKRKKTNLLNVIKQSYQNYTLKDCIIKTDCNKNFYVNIDEGRIIQVFSNLISNSIRYNDNFPEINIKVEPVNSYEFEISISDNGIGISEKEIQNIYKKFYKINDSKSSKEKGFGLGLNIVKNIIEKHNKEINVISKKNSGTKFMFRLDKV